MRCVLVMGAVALLVPATGLAQGSVSGTYVSYNLQQTIVEQPDGTSVNQNTAEEFSTTSTPDSPFNNMKYSCTGLDVLSESGDAMSSAGACAGSNPDGDLFWYWYRMTETGTEACPLMCGVWGIFNGTGFFEGMTGKGTWKTTAVFPDETGAGVWDLKYEKK